MKFTSTASADLSLAEHLKAELGRFEQEFLGNQRAAEVAALIGDKAAEGQFLANMETIEATCDAVLDRIKKIEKSATIEGTSYVKVKVQDEEKPKDRADRIAKRQALKAELAVSVEEPQV